MVGSERHQPQTSGPLTGCAGLLSQQEETHLTAPTPPQRTQDDSKRACDNGEGPLSNRRQNRAKGHGGLECLSATLLLPCQVRRASARQRLKSPGCCQIPFPPGISHGKPSRWVQGGAPQDRAQKPSPKPSSGTADQPRACSPRNRNLSIKLSSKSLNCNVSFLDSNRLELQRLLSLVQPRAIPEDFEDPPSSSILSTAYPQFPKLKGQGTHTECDLKQRTATKQSPPRPQPAPGNSPRCRRLLCH